MIVAKVKDERFFLPLWAEEKFREILMISSVDHPLEIHLHKNQSVRFRSEALHGEEGFIEMSPKGIGILKLMYMGDDKWLEYDNSGDFNIVKTSKGMHK